MIVPFIDSVTGTTIYINPAYVVSMRPDPSDPPNATVVKLQDGESVRVRGEHAEVADKLAHAPVTV